MRRYRVSCEIQAENISGGDRHALARWCKCISRACRCYRVSSVPQSAESVVACTVGSRGCYSCSSQRDRCAAPTRRRAKCSRDGKGLVCLGCEIDPSNIGSIDGSCLRARIKRIARMARRDSVHPVRQSGEPIIARAVGGRCRTRRPTERDRCSASTYCWVKRSRDTKGESCRRKAYSGSNACIADCYVHAPGAEAIPPEAWGDRIRSVG